MPGIDMQNKWLEILNSDDDRLVCRSPGRQISMLQLRSIIYDLQAAILKKRVKKWVLYSDDGFDFICGLFALLLCGQEVLVPSGRQPAVIESLLGQDIGLMGCHVGMQGKFDIPLPLASAGIGAKNRLKLRGNLDLGRISFSTSGSSGKSKLVSKTAGQLYQEALMLSEQWQFSSNTTFVSLVTHLHMYGLTFSFLLPLVSGANFYLPHAKGILAAVESLKPIAEEKIDGLVVITSPTIGRRADEVKTLAAVDSLIASEQIDKVYSAGGKLTFANAMRIVDLFNCPVVEIFGSTETGAMAVREHVKQQKQIQDSPWRVFSNLNAAAIDSETAVAVKTGVAGRLAVWGGHAGGSRRVPITTGDEVRFIDCHLFHLLGRSDRTCKIEGKRVSLDAFSEIIEHCDLISEATVLPHEKSGREILLCGVVLSKLGKSHYHEYGKSATDQVIRAHLLRFFDPALMPRRIRYIDQSPWNAQGKLHKNKLAKLLVESTLPTLPLLGEKNIDEERMILNMLIPMELLYFKGHFDNCPIVPGVVLLHWVYHYSDRYWQRLLDPSTIKRLKFLKLVRPGDRLKLTLVQSSGRIEFSYQNDCEQKVAAGLIPNFERRECSIS